MSAPSASTSRPPSLWACRYWPDRTWIATRPSASVTIENDSHGPIASRFAFTAPPPPSSATTYWPLLACRATAWGEQGVGGDHVQSGAQVWVCWPQKLQ